jgi:hypothetical protein
MPSRSPARAARKSHRAKKAREPKLSHIRRPEGLEAGAWQAQLRRQFGRTQAFKLENLGEEPVFSEFRVTNPQSGGSYRVAIRGVQPGENFCACPDFATNDLGTCKHVEFVLGKLESRRGGRQALARGFVPPYSEIYLQYGGRRRVWFRAGGECPRALARRAMAVFSGSPAGALPEENFPQLEGLLALAQKSGHELRCYEDVLGFIAQVRDADERRRIIDAAYPQGARDFRRSITATGCSTSVPMRCCTWVHSKSAAERRRCLPPSALCWSCLATSVYVSRCRKRELVESTYSLRADVLRELLQRCTSVKTVRLCLTLGRDGSLPWSARLDPATLPTGSGRAWVSRSADGLLVLKP